MIPLNTASRPAALTTAVPAAGTAGLKATSAGTADSAGTVTIAANSEVPAVGTAGLAAPEDRAFPRTAGPVSLLRRVADADLPELIDMAGRLLHRLPQGGPARGQALILSILAGREALSQRELQQMLGIQPGSLSELISKLEAKGFLTREKAEDRRGNLLRITDAGRDAIPGIQAAPEDDPFAPLSPEQQDQLSDMLRALLTRWIDTLEPCPRGQNKPVQV